MALSTDIRRSERYKGDGTRTTFPFPFKVFDKSHVAVEISVTEQTSEALPVSSYNVVLNGDQENNPGGSVTLNKALAAGKTLVVVSAVPYLQPAVFTNRGGFYPEHLNRAYDLLTMQTQQLKERIDRSLTIPSTSDKTPDQLTEELLAAQKEAAKYASQAGESLKKTQQIEQRLTDQEAGIAAQLTEKGNALLSQITTEGSSQQALVKAEGDKQVERIQSLYDVAALSEGMACSRRMIEVSADVPAGTEIVLPNGQQYVVGRNHLLLFYNDLYIDPAHFAEVGTVDTLSNRITLTFDMKHNVGRPNRLTALVIPLGREEVHEMLERVKVVEDALANLSRNVAYLERN